MACSVRIRYLGPIQSIVDKTHEVIQMKLQRGGGSRLLGGELTERNGVLHVDGDYTTVGALLQYLGKRYGMEFIYYTRSADGSLPSHAMIVVDGVNLGHGDVLDVKIDPETTTEIIVVPAVGGGVQGRFSQINSRRDWQ